MLLAILILLGSMQQTPEPESDDQKIVSALTKEFEQAQIAVLAKLSEAKTPVQRAEAMKGMPNRLDYSRRLLEIARKSPDDKACVDALVWVVRHGPWAAENDEALAQIETRFMTNDRIGAICQAIAAQASPRHLNVLQRLIDENPNLSVRGHACLGLAFAIAFADRRLPEDQRHTSEVETWYERVLTEFPQALTSEYVVDFIPIMTQSLGTGGEECLRLIGGQHPDPKIRLDGECGLLLQQRKLAMLLSDLATAQEGSRIVTQADKIPGGLERLRAIDRSRLAQEIDQGFHNVIVHAAQVPDPGLTFFNLLMDLRTSKVFRAGEEALLREMSKRHPSEKIRALARYSLVQFLDALSEAIPRIQFAQGADQTDWVSLLSEERMTQLQNLDLVALNAEIGQLLEQVIAERRAPDPALDAVKQNVSDRKAGTIAPEIEGTDNDGQLFRLSEYRGKVVMLDFWTHTTCAPCRDAYPMLRTLVKKFDGQPFALLGVNDDDNRTILAKLAADGTVTWRFWLPETGDVRETYARWNVQGVPTVILIDHHGAVRARFVGTPSQETLEKAINTLIAEIR